MEWDFFHPYITIVGKYDIHGQVLLLPVRGKGTANITLSQYRSMALSVFMNKCLIIFSLEGKNLICITINSSISFGYQQ